MKHYSMKSGAVTQDPVTGAKSQRNYDSTYKDILPFGKFKGLDVVDVPSSYLRWLCLQGDIEKRNPMLVKAADEELKFREKNGCHFEEDGGRRG